MEEFNSALSYAYLLLKYRIRTSKELSLRLKRRNFSSETIDKVVEFLNKQGYINDNEFIEIFVKDKLSRGWGKKKIFFSLKRLGIEESIINEELEKISLGEYSAKIREVIKRKLGGKKTSEIDKETKAKLFRYLIQRGFSLEEIEGVLSDEHE
ncbi:MAG: regulatory protein RecX [Candidatus Omnitrophica bacterium]|nr:regulatory protein RecX [Candidatus Omnitrophota bacterium]MCM8825951.1 regulatory protein RecX [Candidatus Omnitrophota bacterium]